MRFVVVGEGQPHIKAFEFIVRCPGAAVAYVATRSKQNRRLTKLASHQRVHVYEFEWLKKLIGAEEFRSYQPDWLISTNSTIIFGLELLSAPGRPLGELVA